jgi:hypothetical protein
MINLTFINTNITDFLEVEYKTWATGEYGETPELVAY